MYMANARNLRLGPNATYIPLTCVGGFALGDAKIPNANGFASQWNIGFCHIKLRQIKNCKSSYTVISVLINILDLVKKLSHSINIEGVL